MKKILNLRVFIIGVSSIILVVALYQIADILVTAKRENQAFEDLAERVKISSDLRQSSTDKTSKDRTENDETFPYSTLKKENKDFFGWIAIDGTRINYPVMHTPEDPEYYLRRDFEGEASQSGTPFLDASCYEGCGNYIIYGHNMNDGSMFASLLHYADDDYRLEYPLISFDTLTQRSEYRVAAAFYSSIYYEHEKDVFRYYRYTDLTDPALFSEYATRIKEASLYDTGVNLEPGDELLTLSTCSDHTEDGRFVVVAKREDR